MENGEFEEKDEGGRMKFGKGFRWQGNNEECF